MDRITIRNLQKMKVEGEKIAALTAYDYYMAKFVEEAGIEVILVGDSLNMVVYGEPSTLSCTMTKMLAHTKAVSSSALRALVVGDMPFLSYQPSIREAIYNAGLFLSEGGAQAVKLEGGLEFVPTVGKIIESGIPVMGHLGMLPQSVHKYGGYLVRGKTDREQEYLLESALALQEAGCFAIVLEKVPAKLGKKLTESLAIPTIGIGAGPYCDGQILVLNDMLGLYDKFCPKFVRPYANLKKLILKAVKHYRNDVKSGDYPSSEESF
ncbi:3-methyl-2-oxobutanoate hydroxymethyltransferase [bacterium]|nr:3-methyl-2-oxobutanoate hydroxymethyltransferase [bacterium]